MSPTRGVRELRSRQVLTQARVGRSRRAGGGRPRAHVVDPGLVRELQGILEATTAGDPMSRLKWTTLSTRGLADELTRRGHPVTWPRVARCLHELDYSLQGNRKLLEGDQHPDRDAQFRYINARVKAFRRSGDPVISVDTKKKELIGSFRHAGRSWRPRGRPEPVLTHDFPHLGRGQAVPDGPYDVGHHEAVVNVGVSHDTAALAVESIRRWWRLLGRRTHPDARRLLISAEAGGSNGPRLAGVEGLSPAPAPDEFGLPVTVCHYPPGTSQWNQVEHRLFSFIRITWRGQPRVSYDAAVNLIGQTRRRRPSRQGRPRSPELREGRRGE